MNKKPLFFTDKAEMGDVLAAARSLIDEAEQSRKVRHEIAAETEEHYENLSKKFEYLQEHGGKKGYLEKLAEIWVNIVREKIAASDAEAALTSLDGEKQELEQQYGEMNDLIGQQLVEISANMRLLENAVNDLNKQKETISSDVREEIRGIAENELKEVNRLKEDLREKEAALIAEQRAIAVKKEEITDLLSQIHESMAGEPARYVTREEARLYELNFLTRFDTKMNAFPLRIRNPADNHPYVIHRWECHYRYDSGCEGACSPVDDMPRNSGSVYIIQEKKHRIFGDPVKKLVIEAISCCNDGYFAEYGFDTRAGSLSSLLTFLLPLIRNAEQGDYFHIIGVASPTGWDARVLEKMHSRELAAAYLSRHCAICLVDSMSGMVYFDPTDSRVKPFADFFRPDFDHERIERAKGEIRTMLKEAPYLEMDALMKNTGEDRMILQKAFLDLEVEGCGRGRYDSDIGYVFFKS